MQSFVIMPVLGLNNGMVPIIAYNYGAKNKERIMKTMKLSILYSVGIMLVGITAFQLFSEQLLLMFSASEDMMAIGVPALKIISLSFLMAGVCIVMISFFQALGSSMRSLIVSASRQLAVLLPAAYLLSLSGSLDAVWWSFPIAEVVSFIICIIFMKQVYNQKVKPLGEMVYQREIPGLDLKGT
jgi:Na+-driven multidrug efflux pump